VKQQMIRERLLATLSVFFAGVALLLAAIGLYAVLNAAVLRQRREIGIRMALGAGAGHVVRRVTLRAIGVGGLGAAVGLAGGVAFGRFVEALLFRVTPTDLASLAVPVAVLAIAAALASFPAAIRAVRIDPARTLRTE
jgi:putative ABC transport system permease protein